MRENIFLLSFIAIFCMSEFIQCYSKKVNDSPPEFRFDYNYFERVEGWFKLHRVPRKQSEAKDRCLREGAELAAPTSPEMVRAMMQAIVQSPPWDGVYIDVHATFVTGEYQYKGIPLERFPVEWLPSGPRPVENNNCIVFHYNSSISNENCDRPLPFLCFKKKTDDFILNSCGTEDNEYNYQKRTGSCYKFHTKGRNWADAYTTCMAEGAYLTVVNNAAEIEVLQEIIKSHPPASFEAEYKESMFLGFIDLGKGWITVLDKPLADTYEAWNQGEPSSPNVETCGNLLFGGLMNDAPCNLKLAFICEKNPSSLLSVSYNRAFNRDFVRVE